MAGVAMNVMNTVPQVNTTNLALWLDGEGYSGSGTTWTAYTGSNATLINTPTYIASSPTYFNFAPASSEYATVPNLGNKSSWTIEAWFRVTSSLTGQVTMIVGNEFDLVNKINFSMGTNRAATSYNICIGYFNGAWRNTAGFAPDLNTWYHCAGTYNGTTIVQYVNGVSNTTLSYTGTSQSGGEVRIGARWDTLASSTDYFPGDVAVVRIYNNALTASQVQQNYLAEYSRFPH